MRINEFRVVFETSKTAQNTKKNQKNSKKSACEYFFEKWKYIQKNEYIFSWKKICHSIQNFRGPKVFSPLLVIVNSFCDYFIKKLILDSILKNLDSFYFGTDQKCNQIVS